MDIQGSSATREQSNVAVESSPDIDVPKTRGNLDAPRLEATQVRHASLRHHFDTFAFETLNSQNHSRFTNFRTKSMNRITDQLLCSSHLDRDTAVMPRGDLHVVLDRNEDFQNDG